MRICELVEDAGIVGFETLAVEVVILSKSNLISSALTYYILSRSLHQDKESMLHLMRLVDRALGYAFIANPTTTTSSISPSDVPRSQQDNRHALFSSAAGMFPDSKSVHDIQERWVDAREDYDVWESANWQKEGAAVIAAKARAEAQKREKAEGRKL